MKTLFRKIVPVLALALVLGAFAGIAWMMSRSDNTPVAQMRVADPARPGASVRARRLEDAEPARLQAAEAQAESSQQESISPTPGQRVPIPMFWMALGALSAAIGIFIATRERKRTIFR